MPWCDSCDRFLSPNTVHDDGTCPSCGAKVTGTASLRRARRGRGSSADAMAVRAEHASSADAEARSGAGGTGDLEADAQSKAPWHFKVLLVALVIYLGFRLIQLLVVVGHWL